MRQKKITTISAIFSFFLFQMPLCLFAADSATLPESTNVNAIDKIHRIPWIKPSIPLNTTLKPSPSAEPKKPLLTAAEIEKIQFKQAFAALQNAEHKQAINLFKNFITSYPNSKYAVNSYYWIGEACFLSKDYNGALEAYSQVMIYYPNSREAEESALRSGQIFYDMSNWPRAQKSLHHVVSAYPRSITAKKAQNYLKRMKTNAPSTNS